MHKRHFLKTITGFSAGLPVMINLEKLNFSLVSSSSADVVKDETVWAKVRQGYLLKEDYINLENGYYCMMPSGTMEKYIQHVRQVNFQASYYMRTEQTDNKTKVRNDLAHLVGCLPEELIITRNTTESLDTIIQGYPWQHGDEAIMAEQDYGAMLDMFKLQARRFGIKNRLVSIPNHPKNDEEIVSIYRGAITPRTKLLMVSHMVNITGQILPVRAICDMAHEYGVDVMVDGAHVIGHMVSNLAELKCDYYGSSLHKWLSVPLGAGLLYVNKAKISKIWQIFGDMGYADDDIRKLNHTGTHPVATDLAIQNAIEYYKQLGPQIKEERLRYLQTYWTSKARKIPGLIINTPAEPQRACGIANVGVEGLKPGDLAKILLEKYKIWTVAIDGAGVHGCRITPNVYTTIAELDTFLNALEELASAN